MRFFLFRSVSRSVPRFNNIQFIIPCSFVSWVNQSLPIMYTMTKQHMLRWLGHIRGMDDGRFSQGHFVWIAGIRKAKHCMGARRFVKECCVKPGFHDGILQIWLHIWLHIWLQCCIYLMICQTCSSCRDMKTFVGRHYNLMRDMAHKPLV